MIPFGSRVFFDSDAFIGIIVQKDAHHIEALSLLRSIELSHGIVVTSNLVIAETASTLSRRIDRNSAVNFLRFVHDTSFDVLYFTEELHNKSVELFYSLKQSKTSFIDVSNVVCVQSQRIPYLYSFDKFYTQFDTYMMIAPELFGTNM